MALKVTQEYIARDANNIARVEDYGNIVSIKGNIFLYPPKKSHSILLSFILGFVGPMSSNYLTIVSDCQLPFFSVYKQRVRSARMRRSIIVGLYSGHRILPGE